MIESGKIKFGFEKLNKLGLDITKDTFTIIMTNMDDEADILMVEGEGNERKQTIITNEYIKLLITLKIIVKDILLT